MRRINNIPVLKKTRQKLRVNMPQPEVLLWQQLRARQLNVKFRRQHSINRYIVDFYCAELQLVIELDGDSHYTPVYQQKDELRDRYLSSLGLSVMRFTNEQVVCHLDDVLEQIWHFIDKHNA
ncbi:endonuclease domain-containing protein [Vibrio agarivorans]|uniref:endonuclease domain-containing protein n=1 Tax=Vibrio agarivorans TaxID=153622 RepID=UPI0025B540F1|nr:endonuclease domain-containing protein [Vibrio agarivorans]MDN3662160.1 endonuclease domain-containing protein [Vibrio agarivorans]